jgi:predicted nuclease of predicted toxin-antitoxin system
LSRRLIGQVADLFPGTVHVSSVNLLQASDVEVWEHAKLFGLCIVTADADFYELSITMGAPPKVVWLKGCDYPTSVAAQLIRDQAIRITVFLEDPQGFVVRRDVPRFPVAYRSSWQ